MKKAKKILLALLAIILTLTATIISPLQASAWYRDIFNEDYIADDSIHVKSVLARMERIGLVQGIIYTAYKILDPNLMESMVPYEKVRDLDDGVNGIWDCDAEIDSFDFSEEGAECWPEYVSIAAGDYLGEAFTGKAGTSSFERYEAKNIWYALGVALEIYDENDDVDIRGVICGREDLNFPGVYECDPEEYGNKIDPRGSIGSGSLPRVLIERFNVLREQNGWEEVYEKDKMESNDWSIYDENEGFGKPPYAKQNGKDPKAMDYYAGIAGYGLLRLEIKRYCISDNDFAKQYENVVNDNLRWNQIFHVPAPGIVGGAMDIADQATSYYIPEMPEEVESKTVSFTSYDEEADDGSLKDEEISVYDHYPLYSLGYSSFAENLNSKTCSEIVERANEIAKGENLDSEDPYTLDEIYQMLLNKTCRRSFQEQANDAQQVLKDNTDENGNRNEAAQQALNLINEWTRLAASEGDARAHVSSMQWLYPPDELFDARVFITTKEKGTGYRCVETQYLQSPIQIYEDPDVIPEIEREIAKSTEESCYDSKGALTWIVCPLIVTISDAITGLYDKWIEPNLVFDSSYLLYIGTSSSSPTCSNGDFACSTTDPAILVRQFWNKFRALANILIILLFLVVIASQVTGLGIDNYGIKKLLPKIIAISILVNLSYWICLLAVDAANISGSMIKSLFTGLSRNIPTDSLTINGSTIVFGAVVTIIVAILVAPAVVSQGWAILIPILAGLLTAIIGIIALFAVLALRIMIIWLCVALSGIAIASYILPNTKKLYDIWFSFFWKALLCYPICSAVVYGGQLLAMLMIAITGGGIISTIMALFLCIGPLVMLPTIIKSSFAAARNIVSSIDRGKLRLQGKTDASLRNNRRAREYLADRNEKLAKKRILKNAGYKYNSNTGQYENQYNIRGRRARQILDDPTSTAAQKANAQKILNSIDERRAGYRAKAEGIIAREGIQEQYYGDSGLTRVNQLHGASRLKVAQQQAMSEYDHGDHEALGSELSNMLLRGRVDGDKTLKSMLTDDGSGAYKAAGIMTQMAKTSKGREHLAQILRQATSKDNMDEDGESAKVMRRILGSAITANPEFLSSIGIEGEDAHMAQFLEDAYHGKQGAAADYDSWASTIAENGKTNRQLVSERAIKKPSVLIGQGDNAMRDILEDYRSLMQSASQEERSGYEANLRSTILRGNWSEKRSQLSEMIRAYTTYASADDTISLLQTGKLSPTDQWSAIQALDSKSGVTTESIDRLLSDKDFKHDASDEIALRLAAIEASDMSNHLNSLGFAATDKKQIQALSLAMLRSDAGKRALGDAYVRKNGGALLRDQDGTVYADSLAMMNGLVARARRNNADSANAKRLIQAITEAYANEAQGNNP